MPRVESNTLRDLGARRPTRRQLLALAIGTAALPWVAACQQPAASTPAASSPAETKPSPQTQAGAPQASPASQAAASATQAPAKSGSPTSLTLTYFPGTQMFPALAMERRGLFEKYNLDVKLNVVAGVDASYNALRTKATDIIFGGMHTVALFRTQGQEVINVYSMNSFSNEVVVPNDSPIQSFADLKGKKLGMFGGPAGTTTFIFRTGMHRFFGFDPVADGNVIFSAAPVIAGQLEKREIDAAFLLDPVQTTLLVTGNYRSIGNLGQVWKENYSVEPWVVSIVTYDSWAEQHPEAVTNFIRAFQDAAQLLRTDRQLWAELAPEAEITDPKTIDALMERVGPSYVTQWDDASIDAQRRMAEAIIEYVGTEFMPRWPADAFTTKFVPR